LDFILFIKSHVNAIGRHFYLSNLRKIYYNSLISFRVQHRVIY